MLIYIYFTKMVSAVGKFRKLTDKKAKEEVEVEMQQNGPSCK